MGKHQEPFGCAEWGNAPEEPERKIKRARCGVASTLFIATEAEIRLPFRLAGLKFLSTDR